MRFLEKHSIGSNGFTIVELLVAITLVGVIMTLVFSSIWTARRSWDAVVGKIDNTDSMRLVQGFLRRSLAQSRTVFIQHEDGQRVVFQGDSTWLQFVAPAPVQQQDKAGLYLYTLRFVASDAGKEQLQLAYQNYTADIVALENNETEEAIVLIGDVKEAEITYFGREAEDGIVRWQTYWDRKGDLPELVRVRITIGDEGDEWPEMVIPIKG